MDSGSQELSLRIILQKPTAGVDFALQKGHGNEYEFAEKKRSRGKDLIFDFAIAVKPGKSPAQPAFGGPFVQGPAGAKFIYIDIGTYAGQKDTPWGRRLKIPLFGITQEMVHMGSTLVATIPGSDRRGEPNCAYVWRRQVAADWNWEPARGSKTSGGRKAKG